VFRKQLFIGKKKVDTCCFEKKYMLERKNTDKHLVILFNFRDIYYVSIPCNNPDLHHYSKKKRSKRMANNKRSAKVPEICRDSNRAGTGRLW
jgi:hypothetical protein